MLPAAAAVTAVYNKSTGSVLDDAFRDSDVPAAASSDEVEILPIGSGGEVGRSCVILRYKGRSVMLDCGNHPAKSGLDSLPFFDSIRCDEIDLVLITHFHLDHCGALPYFCEQTAFKGRVFMTSATKAFYKMVMNDFLRVGASANDIVTNEWLQSTIEKIETVEYHEEVTVNGIRFQPFNAGHVLGAALFMVDIAGMKTLYTGDFSRVPDRHLLGAEVPSYSPDILIAESTNGIRELESREERETLFTTWVHDVVKGGGRCLVPVFALGRAQELLLILEEYWEAHKELQHIPIYYASSLAQRCMKLYQTFVSAMNDRVKQQHANHRNPFVFKYIHSLMETRSFEDTGPCVVLASPGMLQSGISLELFERWCGDRRNGIIIAGYCVDGTIAKDILTKPKEVTKPDGKVLPLRMRTIQSVSFSAHSDGRQTRDFIQALPKTQHVILVHGNVGAMGQLRNKLLQDFAERGMKVYSTRNQEAIRIPFSVQRTAKVMGALANSPARNGEFVSGALLVSGQHSYNIVHPTEIPLFTDLNVAQIQQAMVLPLPRYKSALEVLEVLRRYFAQSQMFEEITPQQQDAVADDSNGYEAQHTISTTRITVSDNVSVDVQQNARSQTTLTITWTASHRNDLIADVTCIALAKIMHLEHGADSTDFLPVDVSGNDRLFRLKCFHHMMSQFYPSVTTNLGTGVCTVELEDGQTATITDCIEIELDDNKKSSYFSAEVERLKMILKRVYLTLFPIPADQGWCDCGMIHGAEPLPEEAV
ncbi:putative cleavage and polyadenylation specificity factor subunit [Trypanosoma cruzi]|uniref:Putative cleavage and polyadenylation specificity factor subunit n=1 Tax=Trypanosoma cruzi TaxID=5693 RepID=A0A2V2WT90_TRYCR|nr:putative cleavage and polyadenylation specificity factor subunit [Trypanosoma cruzi]